jgi:hypothetical protein
LLAICGGVDVADSVITGVGEGLAVHDRLLALVTLFTLRTTATEQVAATEQGAACSTGDTAVARPAKHFI